mmetsp:Transcript_34802/g.80445  ORF Transcript_34802/g.80445 Transcript_34802/m.80445 type:complete len:213 (+) Transcript_34802:869-1507(+)
MHVSSFFLRIMNTHTSTTHTSTDFKTTQKQSAFCTLEHYLVTHGISSFVLDFVGPRIYVCPHVIFVHLGNAGNDDLLPRRDAARDEKFIDALPPGVAIITVTDLHNTINGFTIRVGRDYGTGERKYVRFLPVFHGLIEPPVPVFRTRVNYLQFQASILFSVNLPPDGRGAIWHSGSTPGTVEGDNIVEIESKIRPFDPINPFDEAGQVRLRN